ncbi:hypothetical protein [Pseudanabaena sp. FACHB-2040]|uniref:hypothetical protein n=1 Tax=Pseudanabaena sp. FACHB-2040 TaxID=2692859 RepID=UPI0016869991|nr:hypothetical protein [Pseudanabaena sp. FACHB-2040]MBD2256783.1 hypothetical protein [Pseudanabaena sp. FACHB-2040]
MDILALAALLNSCMPFLMKLGEKAAESAGSQIGPDAWETAKKIWGKLHPKLVAKDDARIAAEQVAAKPESEARKAVFQEELETLLKENPDLEEAIARIMQESPLTTAGVQINQTVTNNEGQVIGQMTGGKAIGRIDGNIQDGVNL